MLPWEGNILEKKSMFTVPKRNYDRGAKKKEGDAEVKRKTKWVQGNCVSETMRGPGGGLKRKVKQKKEGGKRDSDGE